MGWNKTGRVMLCAMGVVLFSGCEAGSSPRSQGGSVVCKQSFALCSYAPCRPIPGNPSQALCDCAVFNDYSVGNESCEDRAPDKGPYGLTTVVSSFSLIEIPKRPLMTCDAPTFWTQCLDSPCFVDPVDPSKAQCTCDVQTEETMQTYGGNCDTATCATEFWSGATPKQVAGGIRAIADFLGTTPPQNNECPGDS